MRCPQLILIESPKCGRIAGPVNKKISNVRSTSQSVEELAMGDEGWLYEGSEVPTNGEGGNKSKADSSEERDNEATEEHPTTVAEIRSIIVQLARREDR